MWYHLNLSTVLICASVTPCKHKTEKQRKTEQTKKNVKLKIESLKIKKIGHFKHYNHPLYCSYPLFLSTSGLMLFFVLSIGTIDDFMSLAAHAIFLMNMTIFFSIWFHIATRRALIFQFSVIIFNQFFVFLLFS